MAKIEHTCTTSRKKFSPCAEQSKMVNRKRSQVDTDTVPGSMSPVQEQMLVLQQRIQLLEYDQMTYQESAHQTIKEKQETINFLQQENNKLNEELTKEKQRQATREAKGRMVAVQFEESQLLYTIKRLNVLYHQVRIREKRLEELESLLKQNATVKPNNKPTEEEKIHQLLENKLEEARVKLQDVKHINSVYKTIITHVEEEMPTFQPQIKQLENEILLFTNEFKDLKISIQNAVTSRDMALVRQQHLKKEYRSRCSIREQILRDLTHQTSDKRHFEKEQAKSRDQAPTDEYDISAQEEEEQIRVYEEALAKIKEATGAFNKYEVLQRFNNQQERLEYLEKEKWKAETTLSELKDQLESMNNAFQELKYSEQAKLQAEMSNNLMTMEELQIQLQLESENKAKFKKDAENIDKVLNKATSEVTRLATRLKSIKVPGTKFPVDDISLDLHVLDLLVIIGQKLQKLQRQLEREDIEEICREMEEEEFVDVMEHNHPASNLRISLLSPTDEFESDEEDTEDNEVITRESIKQFSKQATLTERKANLWFEKWLK